MKDLKLKRPGQEMTILAGNIEVLLVHRGNGVSINVYDPKGKNILDGFALFSDEKEIDDDTELSDGPRGPRRPGFGSS